MRSILVLLFILTSSAATADTITDLEQDYFGTWGSGDSATARSLLHTDYHYIGADGERHNRDWTLAMIASGRLVYRDFRIEPGPAHTLGNTVVVMGQLHAPGTWDGTPFVDHLAFTMVWIQHEGFWQLLAEQNSRIQEPDTAAE
jgi:hypothetical protein